MHVRREHYWLGLASLFGVLWAVAVQVENTSPGPLAIQTGNGQQGTCHR